MYFSFFHGLFAIANQTEHDISCVNYDPTETHTHSGRVSKCLPSISCQLSTPQTVNLRMQGRRGDRPCLNPGAQRLHLRPVTPSRHRHWPEVWLHQWPTAPRGWQWHAEAEKQGKNNVYLLWITHILCRCRFHTCVLDIHTSFRLKRSQWKILFIYFLAFKVKF